jgi:hypothetical protein
VAKLDAGAISELVAALFWMYAQTRPQPLRPAWEYEPADCKPIAEPLTRILQRMSPKVTQIAANALDPISLCVNTYALVDMGQKRERNIASSIALLHASRQAEHPDASAALHEQAEGVDLEGGFIVSGRKSEDGIGI